MDSEEKINAFLPVLEEMMPSGLMTLESARVIFYRGAKPEGPAASLRPPGSA